MKILDTGFNGLIEIEGNLFRDDRGWFREFFNLRKVKDAYPAFPDMVQDNLSFSHQHVVRGLHMQLDPFAQAKLVSVIHGKVLDVALDVRPGSATFGQVFKKVLSAESPSLLLIPEGFAHGFAALEDSWFMYKCSQTYTPAAESGVRWNDPELNIDWGVSNPIVSAKDQLLPSFADLKRKLLISPPVAE